MVYIRRMGRRRVDKKYDSRRDELIDAAWTMLVKHGFQAMTLNRYLAACNTSKGAFYHYFDSWEALLEGCIEKVARTGVAGLEQEIGSRDIAPLTKLNRFLGLAATRPSNTTLSRRLFLQIYRARDMPLLMKLMHKSSELSLPLIERVVEDGIAVGQFATPYPSEVAESILHDWNRTLLKVFELLDSGLGKNLIRRDILRRLEASAFITEQLLGLQRGSMERVAATDIDRIIEYAVMSPQLDAAQSQRQQAAHTVESMR